MTRPDLLAIRDEVLSIDRYMGKYRTQRDAIMTGDLDADTKKDMLLQLETERDMILRIVPEMRNEINSPFFRLGNVTGQ